MFFETEQGKEDAWSIKVGPFRFSWHQLYTSFISLLIVLPVNLIIVTLFRKSKRPAKEILEEKDTTSISNVFRSFLKTGKIQTDKDAVKKFDHSNSNDIMWLYRKYDTEKFVDGGADKNITAKERCCALFRTDVPSYGIKIAWTLVVLTCVLSAFFLILYSVDWGKAKSERWLTAFFLSFIQSLFLIDPVKVNTIFFVWLNRIILHMIPASCHQCTFSSRQSWLFKISFVGCLIILNIGSVQILETNSF